MVQQPHPYPSGASHGTDPLPPLGARALVHQLSRRRLVGVAPHGATRHRAATSTGGASAVGGGGWKVLGEGIGKVRLCCHIVLFSDCCDLGAEMERNSKPGTTW